MKVNAVLTYYLNNFFICKITFSFLRRADNLNEHVFLYTQGRQIMLQGIMNVIVVLNTTDYLF